VIRSTRFGDAAGSFDVPAPPGLEAFDPDRSCLDLAKTSEPFLGLR